MVVQARLPAEGHFLGASGQIPAPVPSRQALPDELRSAVLIRTEVTNSLKLCGIQWEWLLEVIPRWQLQGWLRAAPERGPQAHTQVSRAAAASTAAQLSFRVGDRSNDVRCYDTESLQRRPFPLGFGCRHWPEYVSELQSQYLKCLPWFSFLKRDLTIIIEVR